MPQEVTIPDLAVVDFYADRAELTSATKRWMDKHLNSKVLAAENCERRIWIGHMDILKTIPDLKDYRDQKMYFGAPAYSFSLRYISGIANPHGLDRPAYDRFYQSTAKMVARDPRYYQNFHNLVGMLSRDSGFIINNVCDYISPIRPWLIARELGEQQADCNVLIIGELDDNDPSKISDVTQRMIVTANGGERGTPAKLTCVTLGSDEAHEITRKKLSSLVEQEKLRIPTVLTDEPDNLGRLVEEADVVYVTFPIGKHPEFDIEFKSLWKNRARQDNRLMHTDIRVLADEHNYVGLNGYIPASRIRFLHQSRIDKYDAQKQQIENIAEEFADRRLQGLSPVRKMDRYPLPKLTAA